MRHFALFWLAAIILTTPARAENLQSPAITYLQAGILCGPETIGSTLAPGTIEGATHIIADEPDFISDAQVVPAVLGLGFGVKAQTALAEGIDSVDITVTHPAMASAGVTTQSFPTRISGADPSLIFYQFDHSYELVQGTWQFTARAGDETLYAVTFEVVDPRLVPGLANQCGYVDLLS